MISEKDMVLDALSAVKSDIVGLTIAAQETSDPNIRQSFLQFRNQAEQTQMKLSQIATQKGWYIPSPPANDSEVQRVKQQLTQAIGMTATLRI